jgi:alpha-1,4-galacturonosyltransferase
MERTTRTAQIQEYKYRYVALNSIPRQLHCLDLRLANEHANNAAVRHLLPSEELIPALVDNSYFHFVLATDNVLAASVVAKSLVHHSLQPRKVVLHIITDRMTYYPMQAWFSLHPLSPAIIEVMALPNFDRFTKKEARVQETMEKDQTVRSRYRGGSSAIIANTYEKPNVIAAKLKVLAPKYISVMNHIRIHLPEVKVIAIGLGS